MKKFIQFVTLSLFLLLGMGTAYLTNVDVAVASGGCTYTYCDLGSETCKANQNETSCASSDGQLPCSGHLNCNRAIDG